MSSQNSDIKQALVGIYEKLAKPSTKEVGYEQYRLLMQTYINSEKQTNYILQQVSDYISGLSPKEKEIGLKLLPLIFLTSSSSKIYQIVPSILSIFQSNIIDTNIPILPSISNCFGDVVQYSMKNEIDLKGIDKYEQKIYELLQNFCIYNMKLNDKGNKICGSLCLTKLVENCPLVLQPNYLEFIWDNIISLIDKKSFNAKYELLNCLISMILGAEGLFRAYANVTLYKVLDFLTDSDWLKRKLALNVIYTLILYCKEEIVPLREHIVEFLKGLKSDKVKEVRDVCLLILQIFSENENNGHDNNTTTGTSIAIKQKRNLNDKSKVKERLPEREKDRQGNNYISVNTSLSGISNLQKKNTTSENKLSKVLIRSNSNQFDLNNSKDYCLDNDKRALTPIKMIKSKSKNHLINKSNIDNINNRPGEEEAGSDQKSRPGVNKKDNSFINEKMVIRRNPNYSIFKTGPNQDFFKQANTQPDILVLDNTKKRNAYQKEEEDLNKGENINLDKWSRDNNEEMGGDNKNIDEMNDNNHNHNENIPLELRYKDKGNSNNKNQFMDLNSKSQNKALKKDKDNNIEHCNENEDHVSFKNNNSYLKDNQQNETRKIQRKEIEHEKDEDVDDDDDDNNNDLKNFNHDNDFSNKTEISENVNTFLNNKLQNKQIQKQNRNTNNGAISPEISHKKTTNINLNLNPNPKKNNLSSPKEVENKTMINKNQFVYQNDTIPEHRNCNNPQLVTDLLLQMKNLSEKQIILIDTLEEMQERTVTQINSMTSKIYQLESSLSTLTTQLTSLKSNKNQSKYTSDNQYSLNEFTSYNIEADKCEEIQFNLNQKNIVQTFHSALNNDSDLIKLINQITLNQLREVLPSLIEDSISKLISILTKGYNITLIISYFKNVLMGVKCELKKITKSKIKDSLINLLNNADNFNSLTDDNLVDINLILTYFKSSN